MQATLVESTMQTTFGSQVSGAQAQAGTVHPQLNLDAAVQGAMHGTVQAVFLQEAGTTPCMAYWLKMSGRGQWGRAGEK